MANQGAESLVVQPLDSLGNPIESQRIELSGWALPRQMSGGFGTRQRSHKTEYQGNPEATVQKWGPSFPDSSITGEWKNRHIMIEGDGVTSPLIARDYKSGDVDQLVPSASVVGEIVSGIPLNSFQQATHGGFPAVSVDTKTAGEILQEAFQKLAASGQDVEVTWTNTVRRGHVKEADFQIKTRQDVPWKLTFEWFRDGVAQPQMLVLTKPPLDTYTTVFQHYQNLVAFIATAPIAAVGSLFDALSTATGQLQNAATDLQNNVLQVSYLPDTLRNVGGQAQRAISTLGDVQNAAQDLITAFQGTPSDVSPSTDDATNLVTIEAWKREIVYEAFLAKQDAQTDQQAFIVTIAPLIVTSFRAGQATDLRDVSIAFFGTPIHWRDIADFNGFKTSLVPMNAVVLIPKL